MRLMRCHVENFGVLSNFDYQFGPGLTVIAQPNGFGKSTLAAFIKAMLYGLPRTGSRSVSANDRKRYAPWQAGRFGGFLEFEHEGVQYRVTRFFGKTAARDSFSLYDLTARCESDRFSERLGEEIFQLDADSFARSTYMPQSAEADFSATASIRTKLSNLVDDTDDLNNYDSAQKRLRELRSSYRAYRGEGGSIRQLQMQIDRLEEEIRAARGCCEPLERTGAEIERLTEERAAQTRVLQTLREKMHAAAFRESGKMRRSRLEDLRRELAQREEGLQKLNEKYPAGYPDSESVRESRADAQRLTQAQERMQALKAEQERLMPSNEPEAFADEEQTGRDLEICRQQCAELRRLRQVSAEEWTGEEDAEYRRLTARFGRQVPEPEELRRCGEAIAALQRNRGRETAAALPTQDLARLAELEAFFAQGAVDEKELARCEARRQEKSRLEQQREACALTGAEAQRLDALEARFARGVPGEADLQARQRDCERIAVLKDRQEAQSVLPARRKGGAGGAVACVLAGMVLLGAGLFFLAGSHFAPGAVLAVLGFAGLLGGFVLYTRQLVGRAAAPRGGLAVREEAELQELQSGVEAFLRSFFGSVTQPAEQLTRLRMERQELLTLRQKQASAAARRAQLEEEIARAERENRVVFEKFYAGQPYREDFAGLLRRKMTDYELLKRQAEGQAQSKERLSGESARLRAELESFFARFGPMDSGDDFQLALQQLTADRQNFLQLRAKAERLRAEKAARGEQERRLLDENEALLRRYGSFWEDKSREECLNALAAGWEASRAARAKRESVCAAREEAQRTAEEMRRKLKAFWERWRLPEGDPGAILEQTAADLLRRQSLAAERQNAAEKLEAFCRENPESLLEPEETASGEEGLEVKDLQQAEEAALEKLGELDERLQQLRQQKLNLREQTERIPELEDERARLRVQCAESEERCGLLDRTMELLEKAKDNLATSYVGKVEREFVRYAEELLGDSLGEVNLDKDLGVRIDEMGEAREIGFFSAGIVDCVLICMRLALTDALFGGEKPFVILDDPFVNLDDEHTRRALAMLAKIAQTRQVIYLVCNSSRI